MLFRRRRRTRFSLPLYLVIGGIISALAGVSFLWKPENLVSLKDSGNNIFFRLAGKLVSIFPESAQSLIARLFGLGFLCGGGFLVFVGWAGITGGDPIVSDQDMENVHTAAAQVKAMQEQLPPDFKLYVEQVVMAANQASVDGLKALMEADGSITIVMKTGEEAVSGSELYAPFDKKTPPEEEGKRLMVAAAEYAKAVEEDKARREEYEREHPEARRRLHSTATTPMPGLTPGAAPVSTSPTPSPAPTEDPRVAAVDRLMAKAGQQWEAGKRDVSLMLAEEALKDAETNLPAGHPKIEEVKKKVEGARAALKAP